MTALRAKQTIPRIVLDGAPPPVAGAPIRLEIDLSAEVVERIARAVAEHIRSGSGDGVVIASTNNAVKDRLGSLPEDGFLRLKEVLALVPVSRSTWYEGIRQGRYPRSTKRFGPRIAAWDVQDIRKLLEPDSEGSR